MSRKMSAPTSAAIYLILVLGSLLMFVPVFWIVLSSFKNLGEIYLSPATFFPKKWVFTNYSEAIAQFPFLRYLWNSIYVTVTATALTLVINSMAAFALSKYHFPGRDVIFVLMLATLMIPVRVIMIPVYLVIAKLGLANTLAGIIIPPSATPTGVFILRQYMMTIPDELVDAAKIDGAGHFQIYARIILPLSTPALAVLTVFSVMWRWNDFLWPMVVLNRSSVFTLPLALFAFQGDLQTQWHYLLAMTVLTLLPITIIFLILQRSITQGIASAGVK